MPQIWIWDKYYWEGRCCTLLRHQSEIFEMLQNVCKPSSVRSISFCVKTLEEAKLLQMLNLSVPHLISCHAHNEQARVDKAISELHSGKVGAYISDAGMPAISDPGMRLVQAAHQSNISVVPVPVLLWYGTGCQWI